MSQTSATPGREAQSQSSNPGFYRAVGEEIDRLTSELERAHAQEARSRLSAQEWQTRAEEAEHRAEEAEHRAEEAERELSRIQGSLAEFNVWRDMGQVYANVTGQSQDLNPAGQGEREAHSRTLGPEQDIIMTGDATTPGSDQPPIRRSRGGSQSSENPLPHHDNSLPRLGSNLHHGSSSGGSSLSSRPGLKRKFEPAVGDPEGPSLWRPPPPPLTHPREPLPQQLSCAEAIGPGDRNAGPSHVARWGTDFTNGPEYHANMQEQLPAVDKASRLVTGDPLQIPGNPSNISGTPMASTAPPLEKPATPAQSIEKSTWQKQGVAPRTGMKSFFATWPSKKKSDTEQKPKPEVKAMSPVAAGKQPERPSPAKEASATRGEPPKSTSTQSYAGATVAPPPKVQVGAAQTAQPSQTVLKPGNAVANAAVPPAGAPPVNQADENTGLQTVGPPRPQDSSGRGRGSLGRGEAGSNEGGQGLRFGNWQYDGRSGHGGNQNDEIGEDVNHSTRQDHART